MIDVKTAVNAAYQYIKSIQDMMGSSLEDLRLEEVELSEDKSFWLITLGFDIPKNPPKSRLDDLIPPSLTSTLVLYEREYKLFKVNSQTGEVEAMKIREV
ncbi:MULTISPECIES: hypothetical protein [unclassified Nostoc]|uniref:hypothetical protein n=1 Tax=unclassified Nostoc TaxID=2593658 RepID=UPI002AD23182|nr:hypothetical protein [Nostoc sp. DedQUE03]MDZ7971185.1 hypothetical protein [Nostoc sp. DedQUE03]MDZ8048673.1 hypothetical protein [Nostoc sp. DedQUE02]